MLDIYPLLCWYGRRESLKIYPHCHFRESWNSEPLERTGFLRIRYGTGCMSSTEWQNRAKSTFYKRG